MMYVKDTSFRRNICTYIIYICKIYSRYIFAYISTYIYFHLGTMHFKTVSGQGHSVPIRP